VSWVFAALLALAVLVLVGAEWPRLEARFGADSRRRRERERRKKSFTVVRGEDDPEEFAESVRRDLSSLPLIEERENDGTR
jgi:hypothetical protein